MDQKLNQDRRVSTRIPTLFEVSFIHDGDYLISSTKDISADGMFLYTENPPKVNERTTLCFSLGELSNVEIEAEVVWVNSAKESNSKGMAVKFINPSPKVKKAMLNAVNKVAVLAD